jgi:hypothetical protein
MATLESYLSIITSLYRDQPKFMALCTARISPIVHLQDVLEELRAAFDLDSAVGVQLDRIGDWVGRGRLLETPLDGVYFSWDTPGVGWNQGSWKGPYDPETGMVELPDDAYRMVLRGKIAANAWDGTIPGAYDVWKTTFGDTGSRMVIQDNQDMSMIVGVAGLYPDAVTKALLVGGYIPLKPAGVRIEYYAVSPSTGPLFCWGADSANLAGWDKGSWPQNLIPEEA